MGQWSLQAAITEAHMLQQKPITDKNLKKKKKKKKQQKPSFLKGTRTKKTLNK